MVRKGGGSLGITKRLRGFAALFMSLVVCPPAGGLTFEEKNENLASRFEV